MREISSYKLQVQFLICVSSLLLIENRNEFKIYPMTVQQPVINGHAVDFRELQNLLDASPDVICSFDLEGRFVSASAACMSIWGYTQEELIGTCFIDYVHPEDYTKTNIITNHVFEGNDLIDFENRWIRKDGSIVPVEWSAKWYRNKTLLCCVAKDASLRKQKEEEIKISNERFKFVSMATSDVIWDRNLETGEVFFNSSAFVYGVLPAGGEAPDAFWRGHLHPDDKDRVIASQTSAIKDAVCSHWKEKYRFIRTDGSIIHVSDRAVIIRNEKGKAIRMVGAIRNITEAKKLEEIERLSDLRYKLLFENSPFPKWIFEEKTQKIVEVNTAAINQYGYSRKEFLQMSILDLRPHKERIKGVRILKSLESKSDKRYQGTARHQKKNGDLIDVEISSDGLICNNCMHIVVVVNDVTQRIQSQKEIARAIINTQEKERSIIGKELHDNVNQLLTTAKLYVQNTVYFPDQKEVFMEKSADIIQKCIDEIRGLSKELITPTLSDLGFKSTIEELTSYYKEMKLFSVELDYALNENKLDNDLKLSIYRILQELFNNTVKYARATLVRATIHANDHYVRLIYVDNGIGFDPNCLRKGVGITNIKSRVDVHKGKARIISSQNNGCKAVIIFPLDYNVHHS